MKNKILTAFGAAVLTLVLLASPASADKPDKVTLCHASGRADTTHFVTTTVGYAAAYGNGGHFNEDGTPQAGHERDYLGPCITPTQSPSSTPTPRPSPSITATPTPTVSPSPTITPSEAPTPTPATEPTPDPSATPTPNLSPSPSLTPTPNVSPPPTDTASTVETLAEVALAGLLVYLGLGALGIIVFLFIVSRMWKRP